MDASTTENDTGKHWKITSGERVEYIDGEYAETAEAALKLWRQTRGLFFIEATASRTSLDEDLADCHISSFCNPTH